MGRKVNTMATKIINLKEKKLEQAGINVYKKEVDLNNIMYITIMDFFKKDMSKFGHKKDFMEIKKEINKDKKRKMLIQVVIDTNTDLIVGLQIGINQFVSLLVNSDPYQIQNTLERMPEKLVDLIYDTIDEN